MVVKASWKKKKRTKQMSEGQRIMKTVYVVVYLQRHIHCTPGRVDRSPSRKAKMVVMVVNEMLWATSSIVIRIRSIISRFGSVRR